MNGIYYTRAKMLFFSEIHDPLFSFVYNDGSNGLAEWHVYDSCKKSSIITVYWVYHTVRYLDNVVHEFYFMTGQDSTALCGSNNFCTFFSFFSWNSKLYGYSLIYSFPFFFISFSSCVINFYGFLVNWPL